jgi:hypothetical protein
MKRHLLSLCIVGTAFSVYPSHTLQTQSPTATPKSVVEAKASVRLPGYLMASTPEPPPWFEQVAVRSPATAEEEAPSTSLAPGDSQSGSNWVVVIRFATVHSGPSVSAPIIGSSAVGTELHLIDYQYGWFEVSDPVTSQRGWIYERYYLQAIRGPGQGVAALQALATPQQKVVNASKPTPHVRPAKSFGRRPSKKTQPIIASSPRYRYETVASILDRALRP